MYLDRYEGRGAAAHQQPEEPRQGAGDAPRDAHRPKHTMRARQHIYRVDGSRLIEGTGAGSSSSPSPGQGPYWKWAARRALRAVVGRLRRAPRAARAHGAQGGLLPARPEAHRSGPERSPPPRVPRLQPGPGKRSVTLGTSVGWSTCTRRTYYEQWIDVTGLRGCFAYVHRADPKNRVWENNEGNNDSQRIVRLPWRGGARGGRLAPPSGPPVEAQRRPDTIAPVADRAAARARPRRGRGALDQGGPDASTATRSAAST